MKGLLLPLLRNRRGVRVARLDHGLRRQLHQRAHDRVLQVGVRRVARRAHPAHRAAEERVAREHSAFPAREPPGRGARRGARLFVGRRTPRTTASPPCAPGVSSGRTSSAPKLSACPGSTVPVGNSLPHQLPFQRVDQDLELRPALPQRPHLAHVVEVVVGQQHVRWRQPPAAPPPRPAAPPDRPHPRRTPALRARPRPGTCSTGTAGASPAQRSCRPIRSKIIAPSLHEAASGSLPQRSPSSPRPHNQPGDGDTPGQALGARFSPFAAWPSIGRA